MPKPCCQAHGNRLLHRSAGATCSLHDRHGPQQRRSPSYSPRPCAYPAKQSWLGPDRQRATGFATHILTGLFMAGLAWTAPALAEAPAVITPVPQERAKTMQQAPLSQEQQSAASDTSSELPPLPTVFPALPDIKPAAIDEFRLSNGLQVFMLEDHEVPTIQGNLLMRGGQRASPPDKVGVATISASMQRAGGSVQHPGSQLDEALEQMAASIEGGAAGESISMGFECLSEDASAVLQLFREVIMTPALPQAKLDLSRGQVLNLLLHINDSSNAIPTRELAKLIYGKGSVFARTPSATQIRGITRQDVVEFLHTWERPDAAILGVSGDFDKAQMRRLIEQRFGDWRREASQPELPPAIPNTPVPPQASAGTVYLVDRPGQTQATIKTGELGINILDPDACALDVLGDVFNSFGGSLFDELRSREGLAYSVSGGWSTTPADHPGLFLAGGETARPAEFLAALQKVLKDAREVAPSTAVLTSAKSQTLNSFVFNFASSGQQLQRRLVYALLGVPQDFLFQYRAGIEAVTSEDVLAAAQRHLHPLQQTIVIAADKKVIDRASLQAQGWRVQDLDVTTLLDGLTPSPGRPD